MIVWTFLTLLSVLAWAFLLVGRQGFWRAEPCLQQAPPAGGDATAIAVVIPARDEAETIEAVVRSLIGQDYRGELHVIVVDDQSRDDTAAIVDGLIPEIGPTRRLERIGNTDRPAGWSGKLWAIKAGLDHLNTKAETPDILLLTDADIAHDPG